MPVKIEEDWHDADIDVTSEIESVFPSSHKTHGRSYGSHGRQYGTRGAAVSNPDYEGTCRLMQAVLKEAITCYRLNVNGKTKRSQRLFAEVAAWAEGGETQFSVFNFETVCDVVGVDAQTLRAKLRAESTA